MKKTEGRERKRGRKIFLVCDEYNSTNINFVFKEVLNFFPPSTQVISVLARSRFFFH